MSATEGGNGSRGMTPSDRELLARHVDGDSTAFGEIIRRHQDRLWAVALRTTGDPDEAADALQDAVLKAFRAASGFRGEAQVSTWLHRIVVNACLDRLRRNARERPADQVLQMGDALHSREQRSVEEDVALREDVAEGLRRLPVEQRAVLVLVDMLGYPVAEVAQILGCPTGTVKSRGARGRAQLAKTLRSAQRRGPGGNQGSAASVQPDRATSGPSRSGRPELGRTTDGEEGRQP